LAVPISTPSTGSYRALLIDDDRSSVSVLAMLLQQCGCETLVCTDPETAVAQAVEDTLDLVCLDLTMPRLDGFKVYRLIRSHEQSRRAASVPVVTITGRTGHEHRSATLAAGFVAHLDKPVSKAALEGMLETVEALRAHVERGRYSRDEAQLHQRVDEMFPLAHRGDGRRAQGILGLAMAIEQECTASIGQILRHGYAGHGADVQRQVSRLAEFGLGIGAPHWAALCSVIGKVPLDEVPRFERSIVLARAELDRVLHTLRERVLAADS
jgi:CheY-like chemotaxis protein